MINVFSTGTNCYKAPQTVSNFFQVENCNFLIWEIVYDCWMLMNPCHIPFTASRTNTSVSILYDTKMPKRNAQKRLFKTMTKCP